MLLVAKVVVHEDGGIQQGCMVSQHNTKCSTQVQDHWIVSKTAETFVGTPKKTPKPKLQSTWPGWKLSTQQVRQKLH